MMFLGAHVPVTGSVQTAPLHGKEIECESIQLFTKNQVQWFAPPLSKMEIEAYNRNLHFSGITCVTAHDSYLINLCSKDPALLQKSRESFLGELKRAEQLGIPYLIFHPGSHGGAGESWGLQKIAESLNLILEKTEGMQVTVLLETTAGQGNYLGYTFEQLAKIIELVNEKKRVGICVDTAHIFEAGYDIRTREGYESVIERLDKTIGLSELKAFHLNDSKTPLGSRVDRHEFIGRGQIGLNAFRFIVNDSRFKTLPGLLEIPGELSDYARDLEILKKLRL